MDLIANVILIAVVGGLVIGLVAQTRQLHGLRQQLTDHVRLHEAEVEVGDAGEPESWPACTRITELLRWATTRSRAGSTPHTSSRHSVEPLAVTVRRLTSGRSDMVNDPPRRPVMADASDAHRVPRRCCPAHMRPPRFSPDTSRLLAPDGKSNVWPLGTRPHFQRVPARAALGRSQDATPGTWTRSSALP